MARKFVRNIVVLGLVGTSLIAADEDATSSPTPLLSGPRATPVQAEQELTSTSQPNETPRDRRPSQQQDRNNQQTPPAAIKQDEKKPGAKKPEEKKPEEKKPEEKKPEEKKAEESKGKRAGGWSLKDSKMPDHLRHRYEKLSPEEKKQFLENWNRWKKMKAADRESLIERALEEWVKAEQAIANAMNDLGVELTKEQRDKFQQRYRQERRKIEEDLREEIDRLRRERLQEMLDRLKAEFENGQGSPDVANKKKR